MAKKKKKGGLNTPMLVISAVGLVVFLVFIALTVRNIVVSETEAPVMEEVPVAPPQATVDTTYTGTPRSLLGKLVIRDGGAEYLPDMLAEYKPLYAANPDTIGYLKVPGTSIDTVVVQCDSDNGKTGQYKYLRNGFYGDNNRYGNVFLDYRCGKYTLSTNSILYGHTTDDGQQVFYDLEKYQDPEFFKQNPIVEYSTLYNHYKWKIFAVFATTISGADDNGYVFDYIYPTMDEEDMQGYLAAVEERAFYKTGVDVQPMDKVLTLSTCTYMFDTGSRKITTRLVVVARMLRDGEDETIDPTAVAPHDDYRRPQAWYTANGKQNPYKDSPKWAPKYQY